MKKSDLLISLEKRFDYLPKREVERTLEKIISFLVQRKITKELEKEILVKIRGVWVVTHHQDF